MCSFTKKVLNIVNFVGCRSSNPFLPFGMIGDKGQYGFFQCTLSIFKEELVFGNTIPTELCLCEAPSGLTTTDGRTTHKVEMCWVLPIKKGVRCQFSLNFIYTLSKKLTSDKSCVLYTLIVP